MLKVANVVALKRVCMEAAVGAKWRYSLIAIKCLHNIFTLGEPGGNSLAGTFEGKV
jgi:hypothetical protein